MRAHTILGLLGLLGVMVCIGASMVIGEESRPQGSSSALDFAAMFGGMLPGLWCFSYAIGGRDLANEVVGGTITSLWKGPLALLWFGRRIVVGRKVYDENTWLNRILFSKDLGSRRGDEQR